MTINKMWRTLMEAIYFRKFHFELHVEKEPLLVNLDLPEAIAGYLHLAFVFNLKYPKVLLHPLLPISNQNCHIFKECQTLIDIVQRLIAKYGDNSGLSKFNILEICNYLLSGTKTQRNKVSAQSKLENYLAGLGRVLASE